MTSAATAAVSLPLLASVSAQAQTVTPRVLRYTDHEPLGGMRTRFIKDVFFPAIERESNGRLKIEDHWGGELAGPYEALGVVGKPGPADMAIVVPEYTAEELPLHQIFKSFPMGPTGDKQVQLFQKIYAQVPELTAELSNNNIQPIYFGTGYPVAFYGTKPLSNLDDMKGGKWRTASFWHQDFLRNTGAIPVTMHWGPEVPAALKAGTLDGLMVNVDSGYMLKVHEAAQNVLVSKDLWLGHIYLLVMNKTTWDGLEQEDRDAIQRAASVAYETLGSVMDRSFEAQLEELKKAGATVRTLDPDEVDSWVAATKYQDVQTAWAEKQMGSGVENAGPVLDRIRSLVTEAVN